MAWFSTDTGCLAYLEKAALAGSLRLPGLRPERRLPYTRSRRPPQRQGSLADALARDGHGPSHRRPVEANETRRVARSVVLNYVGRLVEASCTQVVLRLLHRDLVLVPTNHHE
jgi:hypothetical protein